jgi:hypothetical protein
MFECDSGERPTVGIAQRSRFVGVSAVSIRLPLAVDGSTADDVVLAGIDERTLADTAGGVSSGNG